jgi:Type II CAAX prenyl endopeptidase Rce1-like
MSTSTWNVEVDSQRFFLWAQIIIAFLLIESALWTVGETQKTFSFAGMIAILAFTVANRSSLRELGLGLTGFKGSMIVVPIALLVASGFLVLGAWAGTLRSLFGAGSVYLHAFGYGIWSLEQEFILNSFFYLLLEKLLGNNHRTALCAALLFSFAHIPNPILVPATLVGGMLFVEAFRKWRNIYPLGLAHAVLGLSLALTVSDSWMHHMRVGLSFLRFHMNG